MITKALIKKTSTDADNHFLVYIPLLRKANAPEDSAFLKATLIITPGVENAYNVGDVVFVGFEDDQADKPVILGKLYTGKEDKENITTTLTVKSVESVEKAQLPASTSIDNLNLMEVSNKLTWLLAHNYLPALKDENGELLAESESITYNKESEELKTVKKALDYIISKID